MSLWLFLQKKTGEVRLTFVIIDAAVLRIARLSHEDQHSGYSVIQDSNDRFSKINGLPLCGQARFGQPSGL